MSEKEKINDELIFQSFSKNYIFDSNREPNKTSNNENIEFTFRKNLFLQKSEDSTSKTNENKNNNNNISSFNERKMNIYSKNDDNIQVSGHFGKSKYDSEKYKNILEENNVRKQPLFFLDDKLCQKYTKPNLNIKKLEKEESKLLNSKIKKAEIRKFKSGARVNSINNSIKDNTNYLNKKKKLKTESTYCLKGNSMSKNYKNKKYNNDLNDDLNYMERKTIDCQRNDPIINRLKKMKEIKYYGEIMKNNTFNKTNNNYINTQIIESEIRPINNNNHNFIPTNGYSNNNKIKKILSGRVIDVQPKLRTNLYINNNNDTKRYSRNSKICRENKENIQYNMNNKRVSFNNNENINNTIMNYSYNRPLHFNEIKHINSVNYRLTNNPQGVKKKNKYEKKENFMQISIENFIKLKNDIQNNILLSSSNNFGNLMKNAIPRTNRNKNNDSIIRNKLSTINNQSFGILKTKNNNTRTNLLKNNISKKKIVVKSYIMKDNFEF